jgi:hypothetical protein
MQHPFDGLMGGGQERSESRPTRRSLLGRFLGAVAVLLGSGAVASAQSYGRRVTTLAYGEEGGWWWSPPRNRRPTTLAFGEEGGIRPPMRPVPPVQPVPPVRPVPPTTLAIGEEGGATTYATGEEGGRY